MVAYNLPQMNLWRANKLLYKQMCQVLLNQKLLLGESFKMKIVSVEVLEKELKQIDT